MGSRTLAVVLLCNPDERQHLLSAEPTLLNQGHLYGCEDKEMQKSVVS